MVCQTRLWSPTYGSPPPQHDHSCLEPGETETEEIVTACIRLGFFLPCAATAPPLPFFDCSGRAQLVHTDPVRAREPNRLPARRAADDLVGALDVLEWSQTRPATNQFGGSCRASGRRCGTSCARRWRRAGSAWRDGTKRSGRRTSGRR
ncbi:hypothetical protein PG993_008422 [Apiospora rasikravindrae]|uniref:Uncharacterized protein n=1 Tax=Apiospora rasikravindrae TaxID=990691 RepID=A0ABR1T1R0_9PEZI